MRRYLYAYLVINFLFLAQLTLAHAQDFSHEPICDKLFKTMGDGNTFHKNSPVPRERLRLLTVQHIDFAGNTQTGQIIVLDVCADAVLEIFAILYERQFPIAKIKLMHHYRGEDELSMADNNTFCHNCRPIKGSNRMSLHAYGTAIDINPIQNPCVYINQAAGSATYAPAVGIEYANRRLQRLGKVCKKGMAEEVVDIFAQHGFYWWGGYWDEPIDYQHFQLSRSMTELYVVMEPELAKATFLKATLYFNQHKEPLELMLKDNLERAFRKDGALVEYYQQDPKLFNKVLKKLTCG